MGEYRKPRVAVCAVEPADAARSCICELSEKLPTAPDLFVLVSDDGVVTNFDKLVSRSLPEPVRGRMRLVSQDGTEGSGGNSLGTSDGQLTADSVMDFSTWMDQRSAGELQDHLDAGQCIIFVRVTDADEESRAYRTFDRFCLGNVQMHDLPA